MTSSSSDTTSSSITGSSPLANKLAISIVANDPSTIKKGLLWQQRDRFFSRWKERYFVLTKDYLACFKKGSKVGMSEMGSFMYKVMLNRPAIQCSNGQFHRSAQSGRRRRTQLGRQEKRWGHRHSGESAHHSRVFHSNWQ